eukprot:TRINITY_DN28206_c1_g1_i1.p1 TRINITY_DN28206_c1_g1~~TRINITY_DN28206_c1_g1_i1.p1  ORF type:complete len:208 (-),score=-6.42 TRINITY_DN28206_c1_g1_i1:219-842(-)
MWCLRTQLKIYQVPSDYLIVNYKILFIQQQLFKRAIDMQTQNIHPQLYTLFFLIAPHFFVKKVQKKWHRFKVLEKFQQVKKVSGRCRQKKLKLNQKLEVSQVQRRCQGKNFLVFFHKDILSIQGGAIQGNTVHYNIVQQKLQQKDIFTLNTIYSKLCPICLLCRKKAVNIYLQVVLLIKYLWQFLCCLVICLLFYSRQQIFVLVPVK